MPVSILTALRYFTPNAMRQLWLTVLTSALLGCGGIPTHFGQAEPSAQRVSLRLPDGGRYVGEQLNGQLHGKGELSYRSGEHYIGDFRNGMRHGTGRLTTVDGLSYEGAFANGLFHGNGVLTYGDGDRYDGEFRQDQFHGQGTYSSQDGTTFAGEFKDDTTDGNGVITYPSGDRYEGAWEDWQAEGKGTFVTATGDIYEGQFNDGAPDGQIRITFDDGSTYEGGMASWTYEGSGTYISEKGVVWRGTFSEGSLQGAGTITRPNGDRYDGELEGWRPNGVGISVLQDGTRYEGEYQNGRYSGKGELRSADGSVYRGAFRRGEYHGTGTLHRSTDANPITGRWERGLYVGPDRERYVAEGIGAVDGERLLTKQNDLMRRALSAVAEERPDQADLYVVTFAAHGQQQVFRLEAETAATALQQRFTDRSRILALVNSPATTATQPLATRTNLREAISEVGNLMDRDRDLLLLFLTSHGSKDQTISVNLPGHHFDALSAQELRHMLDEAEIRWRAVIVSACYSGGFIEPLNSPETLIITSARADRTSFGCSDDAAMTYFGKAFFEDALPRSADLISAFFDARRRVSAREAEEGYEPSEPQIHVGSLIEQTLQRSFTFPLPELGAINDGENKPDAHLH
ncbi:MAG: C13 family peptidase [Pseudomonadota bacterium]